MSEHVVIRGFAVAYSATLDEDGGRWSRGTLGPTLIQASDLPSDLQEKIHRYLIVHETARLLVEGELSEV